MDKEFYRELRNPSRRNSDRYKDCDILEDLVTGDLVVSTREIADIPSHINDIYYRVNTNEVDRLDLIAHKYYRNSLLWWVIAQANNIKDPFKVLPPDTLLRIPALETLYGNNGILL